MSRQDLLASETEYVLAHIPEQNVESSYNGIWSSVQSQVIYHHSKEKFARTSFLSVKVCMVMYVVVVGLVKVLVLLSFKCYISNLLMLLFFLSNLFFLLSNASVLDSVSCD